MHLIVTLYPGYPAYAGAPIIPYPGYRVQWEAPVVVPEIIDWIIDPFAREFGEGKLSVFTRDFFSTGNHRWLDCYHVDGFRYDCVPNYWDGCTETD